MDGSQIAAAVVALGGFAGGVSGAYKSITSKIEAAKSGIVADQAAFIKTTLEREDKCREDNHALRNEQAILHARLLVVERAAMHAEVHLELKGKLDQVLDHFGIVPALKPATLELIAHAD